MVSTFSFYADGRCVFRDRETYGRFESNVVWYGTYGLKGAKLHIVLAKQIESKSHAGPVRRNKPWIGDLTIHMIDHDHFEEVEPAASGPWRFTRIGTKRE
jgi:hypothetical protein